MHAITDVHSALLTTLATSQPLWILIYTKNLDISFLGSDLFNFDLANELDEYIEIKIKPTDSLSWSVANNKSGLTLAMFYIYSFSREANERRAKEIRKLLVLKESMLPS